MKIDDERKKMKSGDAEAHARQNGRKYPVGRRKDTSTCDRGLFRRSLRVKPLIYTS